MNWKTKALKRVDCIIGPTLCRHLRPHARRLRPTEGLKKKELTFKPVPVDEVTRILVVRPGGLGDAALTLPMLKALHSHYRGAIIDILAESRNAGVFSINQKLANRIYLYNRNPLTTFRHLRDLDYDLVIDTEQFHHLSAIFSNTLRPKYLCGFNTLSRKRLQTHPVPYSQRTYEVISFLALAEAVIGKKFSFDPDQPFIEISEETSCWADSILGKLNHQSIAVVMPSAMGKLRLWPAQKYAKVVRWLIDRGFSILIVGGKDAVLASRTITRGLDSSDVLDLSGSTTLEQTAALVEKAKVYISSDTGVLHLAYGVGTSTVSLFGSGNYEKWAPPGRSHAMVRKGLACSPCTKSSITPPCPQPEGMRCMDTITVDEVTTSIEKVLEQ